MPRTTWWPKPTQRRHGRTSRKILSQSFGFTVAAGDTPKLCSLRFYPFFYQQCSNDNNQQQRTSCSKACLYWHTARAQQYHSVWAFTVCSHDDLRWPSSPARKETRPRTKGSPSTFGVIHTHTHSHTWWVTNSHTTIPLALKNGVFDDIWRSRDLKTIKLDQDEMFGDNKIANVRKIYSKAGAQSSAQPGQGVCVCVYRNLKKIYLTWDVVHVFIRSVKVLA